MTATTTTTGLTETQRYAQAAAAAGGIGTRVLAAINRATGLTASGLVLAAVIVGAWVLGYLVAGRPLYLVAYGALAFLVVSWLIGRRPLPLEGRRSAARARLREGEVISLDVSLTAARRISTFILEEKLPALLGQNARLPVASLDAGDSVSQGYTVTCWRRGVYELGPLLVRWGDPFGLTQRAAVLAEPFELLVHPTIEPVHDRALTRLWEDPPVRPPVSKPWPSGMEFYGMRKYAPGDDIRKIVWRAYGRTGQLMVREAEQGITDKVVIILDQDEQHHQPGPYSESFELAVRVAASLGVHHLHEGYSVTLEGSAHRLAGPLRAGNSELQLLDELARVGTERIPLTEPLMRVVASGVRDAQIIFVTPYLEPAAAARLKLLLDKGTSVLVVAVVWDELAVEALGTASAMGAQVVEVRQGTPLSVAFRHEIGAGRR